MSCCIAARIFGLHTRFLGFGPSLTAPVSDLEVLIHVQSGQLLLTAHFSPPSLMVGTAGAWMTVMGWNLTCPSGH